jgi:hypothetical protein
MLVCKSNPSLLREIVIKDVAYSTIYLLVTLVIITVIDENMVNMICVF